MARDEIDDFLDAGSKDDIDRFLDGDEILPNRGGIGRAVTDPEERKRLAAERLVARERAVNFRPGDLLTKAEATEVAKEAGIPVGNIGEVVSTAQVSDPKLKAAVALREAASQSAFGVPGAIESKLEDLVLNQKLKALIGSQALKEKAPEYASGGAIAGQVIPTRLVAGAAQAGAPLRSVIGPQLPRTVGQKILRGMGVGGAIGATASGSGAVEEGDDLSEIAKKTAIGGGTGALIGGGIPAAARGFQAASGMLKKSAEKNVSQALLPTTKQNKAIAERITPEILDRPRETFALTKEGLARKTEQRMEQAGEAIEDFGKLKGDVKTAPVLDALENLKVSQKHVVEGKVINPDAVKHIDEVKDLISQFGDSISKEGLRDIKRGFDQATYGQKGAFPTYNEKSLLGFKKVASDEIRELLAKEEPDLAKLNKQFNFWSNFNKVIGDTVERTKGQQGAMENAATMFGATTGTGGTSMIVNALTFRFITKAVRSPGWKLTEAHTKNALANALVKQNPQAVTSALLRIDKNIGEEYKAQLPELKNKEPMSDVEKQLRLDRELKKVQDL